MPTKTATKKTVVKRTAAPKKAIAVKADTLPPKPKRTPKAPGLCVNGFDYGHECPKASLHYYQNGGPNSETGCRGATCRAINTDYYAARRHAGKDAPMKATAKTKAPTKRVARKRG